MICASRPVPSVVTTIAWVSPRVNNAEPWVRGSTPTSIDRPHGARVAAVDAPLAVEDAAADDSLLELLKCGFDLGRRPLRALDPPASWPDIQRRSSETRAYRACFSMIP